jgi:hypothetical protein
VKPVRSQAFDREALIARRRQGAEYDSRKDTDNEEARVLYLLQVFRVPAKKYDMLEESFRRVGRRVLTLDLFNEMVPNFPILLGWASKRDVDRLHADNRATWQATFLRFREVPFVRAYERFYAEAETRAAGRAVGLLFPRKGVPRGFIIHDGVGLSQYWHNGVVQEYRGGTREDPHSIIVEPFAALVTALYNGGHGFRPDFAF